MIFVFNFFFLQKLNLLTNSFIKNSLDPDLDQHCVRHDLCTNSLQKFISRLQKMSLVGKELSKIVCCYLSSKILVFPKEYLKRILDING